MKSILTPEDRYTLGMLGCVEALRFGTTTITENYEGSSDVAPAIRKFGMRGVISEIVNDADMVEIRCGRCSFSEEQADRQLQRSIDQIEEWHGAEDSRITRQVSAHAPDTCSRELLERLRDISDERGLERHIDLARLRMRLARSSGSTECARPSSWSQPAISVPTPSPRTVSTFSRTRSR